MKYMLFLLLAPLLYAQETFPVNDVQDVRAHRYAFTNATLYVDYQTKIENATLLIEDGRVIDAAQGLTPPEGSVIVDLKGMTIYPGLIDLYTTYGMPKPPERGRNAWRGAEQIDPKTKGAYNANDAIKAHQHAAHMFSASEKQAKTMRKLGFGAVMSHVADGIMRGTATVATLGHDTDNEVLLAPQAAAMLSFDKGSSSQNYPVSIMGVMALIRQTAYDARWYEDQRVKPFRDQTLEAILDQLSLPHIMEAENWKNVLRADKVGDEFDMQFMFKTGGDSYQRIAEIKASGGALIVPVVYPDAYDVTDPLDAHRVNLSDMKHWELAPTNLGVIEQQGIPFAITTDGLGKEVSKKFWSNLRKAVDHGLSKEGALKALTLGPAELIRMDDHLGHLRPGALANFLVTNGDLFDKDTSIYENWIQGKRYRFKDPHAKDRSGVYALTMGDESVELHVKGKAGAHSVEIKKDEDKTEKATATMQGDLITLAFDHGDGKARLSGWMAEDTWQGSGETPDGTAMSWSAKRTGDLPKDDKKGDGKGRKGGDQSKDDKPELGVVTYPFAAYGVVEPPTQETFLITNATVWTLEGDGKMEETDVLVENGKIAKIGKNLRSSKARKIDGTGKHLTPGIVDEHSHLALDAVNDTATNSSMVRIKDVVDSEDVGIYRALAGGVTSAQLLHGSANPIGGQSALVKFRWGVSPEEMLIKDADNFIKFALGENVKRSRNPQSVRYPQSRMGVEQVYMDAFAAARDYEAEWNAYNALSDADQANTPSPRRDLTMDAMVEIMNGERFITCHSYVQSEINMLMKVAESFDFRINTFTHILEGYKVADIMAEHGVGGSTFSDWWNFKWEVRYAIPYNPALMAQAGVTVAVNSDSAEMIRRLNQEAAKAVKYGGMDEVEALKMVTLNPAKLLHLDKRTGSIKEGKDADLVLWSDHPLSIYAKAEKTMVDGILYFDLERDAELRRQVAAERARLIQKQVDHKKAGGATKKRWSGTRINFHCDDMAGKGQDHEDHDHGHTHEGE